jgi:hypothetical protein
MISSGFVNKSLRINKFVVILSPVDARLVYFHEAVNEKSTRPLHIPSTTSGLWAPCSAIDYSLHSEIQLHSEI